MFANAKKVAAPPKAAKAKTEKHRPLDIIQGYAEVAAIAACMKSLESLYDLRKSEITEEAQKRLLARGVERGCKPDSIEVADRGASGTLYVTKRSTRSPLTPEEIEALEALDVATEDFLEVETVQPAMLAVNPDYADDTALLARIDKALCAVKGIPEDFIIQTEAVTKTVVSNTAVDELFRQPKETAEALFDILASVALRPVFRDMEAAWEMVRPLLAPTDAEAKAAVAEQLHAAAREDRKQA